jgi:hypothetical protein
LAKSDAVFSFFLREFLIEIQPSLNSLFSLFLIFLLSQVIFAESSSLINPVLSKCIRRAKANTEVTKACNLLYCTFKISLIEVRFAALSLSLSLSTV